MQSRTTVLGQVPASSSFQRTHLPISSVSLLGECETKYADAIFGRLYATTAMKIGAKKHEELAKAMPKISKEEIIRDIREGKAFGAREITVTDERFKLKGRLDQLDLTGRRVGGKMEGIVIDDKYTRMRYTSIPPHYKLQLAAYASAISNSTDYGSLCEVTGAKLICRNKMNHAIDREFSVGCDELAAWRGNVPLAAKVAWVLYEKKREPGHRRLDIGTGEWKVCECSSRRL